MLRRSGRGALALFALAVCTSTATAQDTNWYGRIAAHHAWPLSSDFRDRNCVSPTATFGCASAIRDGSFGGAWGFETALGRRFAPWLRSDLSVAGTFGADYRGTLTTNGAATGRIVRGSADSWQFMVNAAIDGAGLAPQTFGPFNPYAMAGIGAAVNHGSAAQVALLSGPGNAIQTSPRSNTSFAWQVGAGVQYRASERIIFDVGYTYVDAGRAEIGGGPLLTTLNGASTLRNGDPAHADLRFHRLHFGIVVPFSLGGR